MQFESLIQKDVTKVAAYSGVNSAYELLINKKVLAVFDNEVFIGVLTLRDLAERPHRLVIDCLKKRPIVNYNQKIELALELMEKSQGSVLPVFKNESFIGIITQEDITRHLFESQAVHKLIIENERKKQFILTQKIHEEIAERKRIEEDLIKTKEENDKYLMILEEAKDGVIIIQDGICKFANKAMAKITGYTVKEILGKSLSDIGVSKCQDLLTQECMPCCLINGEVHLACKTKIQCKDGKVREIESSAGILKYNGRTAVIGIIRDITKRRKMEIELQKIQKLESVGILAGGIAHDFNNLLTAIIGNLSLGKIYVKSEDNIFEILEEIEKASLQAKKLTQQLLTFSKGGEPVKKVGSFSKVLKDTASFSLSGSNVSCELSIPDDLWFVEIDEGQLYQGINNLVINADQAMPEGGAIHICAKNVIIRADDALPLKEGNYIKISIKDQGIGIQHELIHKIFDPYFSTKSKGSGLGLAITYSIIKKHRGYITAESKIGTGTTFHIYLPASKKEIFTIEKIEKGSLSCGEGRVLVMDDQEEIRNMIKRMLKHLGYEAEFVKDGTEAIELYEKEKESGRGFNAVILDLTIPGGMGGKEVINRLLTINPEVKAIVSSGYSNAPIMSEYKKYGFKGVVAKPYEIRKLSEILYNLLMVPDETAV